MARTRKQSRNTRKQSKAQVLQLKSGSPREIRAMNSVIEKGPLTVMLVFSRTCPHCTTYMPIWKQLCKTQGRKANMVSMEASTYEKTPMSASTPVTSVPTVLYVDKSGSISEASNPRDTTDMTNAVRLSSPSSSSPSSSSSENPLHALPASVVQSGGSPWAAFVNAFRATRKRR